MKEKKHYRFILIIAFLIMLGSIIALDRFYEGSIFLLIPIMILIIGSYSFLEDYINKKNNKNESDDVIEEVDINKPKEDECPQCFSKLENGHCNNCGYRK